MSKSQYIISVYPEKSTGLQVGISKGIKVVDIENGITVISESEPSQLKNKEKCFAILQAYYDSWGVLSDDLKLEIGTIPVLGGLGI